LFVDTGHGFRIEECIERFFVPSRTDREFYVHFPRPVLGLRLDPSDGQGEFHLEAFRVEPVPFPRAFLRAVSRKLQLLREHRNTGRVLVRGLTMLAQGRFRRFLTRVFRGLQGTEMAEQDRRVRKVTDDYEAWRQRRRLTDADRERMRADAAAMADAPRLSVIMPVYNTPEAFLRRAIDSVLSQTYPFWELCIADDQSTAPHVRGVLEEYTERDPRVRIVHRPRRGNIAAASNSALELATGDYIALLDHDDELAEHALFRVAETLIADRDLDMVYSDEDKLDFDGRHIDPFFKPDWSPEYFLSCMYTCHLGVYRTALVRQLGGFRSAFDTAQDYDLALRLVTRTSRIAHISDILYHWRQSPTSTAAGFGAKPQAFSTARRALQSYLNAAGLEGSVEPGPVLGFHRVRYTLRGRPKVSIIIPTGCRTTTVRGKETTFLARCLESIRRKSTYENYEFIVVDNGDMPPALAEELDARGIRHVSFTQPFNLAAKMNLGAAKATGEHLVFLNDDIEVDSPDWLECFLEYSQQPGVGAVGAKLLFPDGRLQHVGVTLLNGYPGHPFYLSPGSHLGYFCGNVVTRNYSAVTGACMMTRAELFRELGGFDQAFTLCYNDIDYCLRLIMTGRRMVYTPYAQLYHHESASRKPGVPPREVALFKERWGGRWHHDPYYNPNLTTRYNDFRILADGKLQDEANEPVAEAG
jgi:glycosyltransferase involved in cell wall biosynthesis